MQLDSKQIEQLANLARLELSSSEIKQFTKQLGDVLGYFEKLTQLDTQGVEPTSQSIDLKNINRVDEIRHCEADIQAAMLDNFPNSSGNYIKTNKVL